MNNLSLSSLRQQYAQGLSVRAFILSLREQALEQSDFNAWITLLSEAQLETYFQRLESQSSETLPLYGVPFAIKDNIDLVGVETTAACPAFAYTPEKSAFVVQCLIDAGAVPLGKTNLDQFATGLNGTRSPYGEGKNAFNPEYISGGSSAGSAISTALGQVSFALGTDTAGSGRVPAVLNNLIGHKPSVGLLSATGLVPACRTLDCISIFALNAEDAAAVLEVAAQYDEADSYCRANRFPNTQRYFSEQLASKPFTFGIPTILDFQGNKETEALYYKSVELLESMGGRSVSIEFEQFLDVAKLLYEGPWVSERWLAVEGVDRNDMLPVIIDVIDQAVGKTAADGFSAQYRVSAAKRVCDQLMAAVDFVVMPTMPTFYTRAELNAQPIHYNSVLGTYTNFVNLLDYSATAVPIGMTSVGVPWGVTLLGQAFEDVKLLSFSAALHRAAGIGMGSKQIPVPESEQAALPPVTDTVDVVVCGAHLSGQPLNWQLTERGASLVASTVSADCYKLYALPDGKRPAMVRDESGTAIDIEVWRMPTQYFGSFVQGIPEPLGIGKVELGDGRWVSGFICEPAGLNGAQDITEFGGWRRWIAQS